MNFEAVTVCYRYADFLRETIRHNRGLFDRWVVVTGSDDAETRHLCREMSLECIAADESLRDEFAKGRMIERGLHLLSANSWRLHIDADIVLPSYARRQLELADLDPDCVYGADRVMVKSWADWRRLQASGWLHEQRSQAHYVNFPDGFPVGTRWASPSQGYVPIGFFQLWHAQTDEWCGARVRPYPQVHGTACRTDVQHALQWDRRKRVLLPELIVAHLESEPAKRGANWSRRTTKRFEPPAATPPAATPQGSGSSAVPAAAMVRKPAPHGTDRTDGTTSSDDLTHKSHESHKPSKAWGGS